MRRQRGEMSPNRLEERIPRDGPQHGQVVRTDAPGAESRVLNTGLKGRKVRKRTMPLASRMISRARSRHLRTWSCQRPGSLTQRYNKKALSLDSPGGASDGHFLSARVLSQVSSPSCAVNRFVSSSRSPPACAHAMVIERLQSFSRRWTCCQVLER
ncbi:hypothetical protein OH77DRAFT_1316095 [Trametes cingulata]|nr:hypothetical protein OH77DRAFT_1316095 [Trametes cingulata]